MEQQDALVVIKQSDLADALTALRNDMGKKDLVNSIELFVFPASEVFEAGMEKSKICNWQHSPTDPKHDNLFETYTDYEKSKI